MLNKTEAQKRSDQIKAFLDELRLLENEKVIALTGAQRQALDAHYRELLAQLRARFDVDRSGQAKQLSLGMRIVSFLGALAFAASIFFFFYQFWGRLTTAAQTAILVAAPLLALGLTAAIARRDQSGYFVKIGALVSFACFVLDISMLGQAFNVTPSDKALIVWGAFAFLLAYGLDMPLLLSAGILCALAFVAARVGTWSGLYWIDFGSRPENFFLPAAILFAVPWVLDHRRHPGFAPIYRVLSLTTALLCILVLGDWGSASYIDMDTTLVEDAYQVAGFVVSAAAIWLGIRRGWPDVVNTGNVFFVIFLYTKFFDWWWAFMPKWLFFLIIGLTALLFLLLFRRLRQASNLRTGEATA